MIDYCSKRSVLIRFLITSATLLFLLFVSIQFSLKLDISMWWAVSIIGLLYSLTLIMSINRLSNPTLFQSAEDLYHANGLWTSCIGSLSSVRIRFKILGGAILYIKGDLGGAFLLKNEYSLNRFLDQKTDLSDSESEVLDSIITDS